MNVDTLDQLSDEALNEVFAAEVCGWELGNGKWEDAGEDGRGYSRTGVTLAWEGPWVWDGKRKFHRQGLNFCASADAVLPYLEKHFIETEWCSPGQHQPKDQDGHRWRIRIPGVINGDGRAMTFARAACLALIMAARAKKKAEEQA